MSLPSDTPCNERWVAFGGQSMGTTPATVLDQCCHQHLQRESWLWVSLLVTVVNTEMNLQRSNQGKKKAFNMKKCRHQEPFRHSFRPILCAVENILNQKSETDFMRSTPCSTVLTRLRPESVRIDVKVAPTSPGDPSGDHFRVVVLCAPPSRQRWPLHSG